MSPLFMYTEQSDSVNSINYELMLFTLLLCLIAYFLGIFILVLIFPIFAELCAKELNICPTSLIKAIKSLRSLYIGNI